MAQQNLPAQDNGLSFQEQLAYFVGAIGVYDKTTADRWESALSSFNHDYSTLVDTTKQTLLKDLKTALEQAKESAQTGKWAKVAIGSTILPVAGFLGAALIEHYALHRSATTLTHATYATLAMAAIILFMSIKKLRRNASKQQSKDFIAGRASNLAGHTANVAPEQAARIANAQKLGGLEDAPKTQAVWRQNFFSRRPDQGWNEAKETAASDPLKETYDNVAAQRWKVDVSTLFLSGAFSAAYGLITVPFLAPTQTSLTSKAPLFGFGIAVLAFAVYKAVCWYSAREKNALAKELPDKIRPLLPAAPAARA